MKEKEKIPLCESIGHRPLRGRCPKRINAGEFEKIDENKREMSLKDKYAIRQMKEGIKWDPEKGNYRTPIPHKDGRQATADVLNN